MPTRDRTSTERDRRGFFALYALSAEARDGGPFGSALVSLAPDASADPPRQVRHMPQRELLSAVDAIARVLGRTDGLLRLYAQMREHWMASGPPRPKDWPDEEDDRQGRSTRWSRLLLDWRDSFHRWHDAIGEARAALATREVETLMDGDETRPTKRWSAKRRDDLGRLEASLHRVRWGEDGLGIVRAGPPPLSDDFGKARSRLEKAVRELRDAGDASRTDASDSARAGVERELRPREKEVHGVFDRVLRERADLAQSWAKLPSKRSELLRKIWQHSIDEEMWRKGPPKIGSFERYLRTAGIRVSKPRAKRAPAEAGRSVVPRAAM